MERETTIKNIVTSAIIEIERSCEDENTIQRVIGEIKEKQEDGEITEEERDKAIKIIEDYVRDSNNEGASIDYIISVVEMIGKNKADNK